MRLYLKTSESNVPVPFDHLHLIVGSIHKWLGSNNKYHDTKSLYSFSWLKNSLVKGSFLEFPDGTFFFISAYEKEMIQKILTGIQLDPILFSGMRVTDVQIQSDKEFQNGTERFTLASPILLKKRNGERIDHLVYNDPSVNDVMTSSMINKMEMAKIDYTGFRIEFDQSYSHKKTKLVSYNEIKNRASMCPVLITGTAEQKQFAWNVGIGNSTGIGFGALS